MPEVSVCKKPAGGENWLVGGVGKFKHFSTGLPEGGGRGGIMSPFSEV